MGKSKRYFRQSKKSITSNESARNFSQVNRGEGWHTKILNFIKVRGKGGVF